MEQWIFAVLMAIAPPDRYARAQALPGWEETVEQRIARYKAIAADLGAVIGEGPLLHRGPDAKRQTAALILAVAQHESGFAPDVDLGPCYRGRNGKSLRCDAGRAACLLQIRAASAEEREALFKDRKRCFREGRDRLRRSLGACRDLEQRWQLASYASGNCRGGRKESEEIFAIMNRTLAVQAPVASR